MIDEKKYPPYPEYYLHVRHCQSGEEWIRPLTGQTKLDLTRLVKRWIREEFCGELRLDGGLMPLLDGEYYAQINSTANHRNRSGVGRQVGFT